MFVSHLFLALILFCFVILSIFFFVYLVKFLIIVPNYLRQRNEILKEIKEILQNDLT